MVAEDKIAYVDDLIKRAEQHRDKWQDRANALREMQQAMQSDIADELWSKTQREHPLDDT